MREETHPTGPSAVGRVSCGSRQSRKGGRQQPCLCLGDSAENKVDTEAAVRWLPVSPLCVHQRQLPLASLGLHFQGRGSAGSSSSCMADLTSHRCWPDRPNSYERPGLGTKDGFLPYRTGLVRPDRSVDTVSSQWGNGGRTGA